jgi:diguanylate cyclase (GGDEF)-like protein
MNNYSIALRDQTTWPESRQEGTAKRGKSKKRKAVSVTASIGLAERNEEHNKPEQVLKTADRAPYKAKKSSRSCLYFGVRCSG